MQWELASATLSILSVLVHSGHGCAHPSRWLLLACAGCGDHLATGTFTTEAIGLSGRNIVPGLRVGSLVSYLRLFIDLPSVFRILT
jgi:hypothetical protein